MAKPAKKKDTEDYIILVMTQILQGISATNKLLRITEANNERRHKELLQAISEDGSPDASKVVYTKLRREKIPT